MKSKSHYIVSLIEENFKSKYKCIFERCIKEITPPEILKTDDFGKNGRGHQYLTSVFSYPSAREEGACSLLSLFPDGEDNVIFDGFGGNGYVAKIAQKNNFKSIFITNDISSDMVENSIKEGFPTTWQSADNLNSIKTGTLDGVLYAYGVHHLPVEKRVTAFREVYRVLENKGKFVLHDFSNESRMALFFNEVVNKYSITGHDCPHFDEQETQDLLKEAGFKNIVCFETQDDFVFNEESENKALEKCANYIYYMYALEKIGNIYNKSTVNKILDITDALLGIEFKQVDSKYECRVKRNAIVFDSDKQKQNITRR